MSRLVLTQITIKKERSISSTTWYYLLQPANASAPDPDRDHYGNPPPTYSDAGYSGWSTTEPTYTVGDNRVLYVMVQTLYSDGTFSYSTPTISSSYEAAKDAYNEVIQAETTISEFEELGLKRGYVWDNMTYVAPSGSIPAYPIGTYVASGMLVNGQRSITRSNSNTYGLNTWISTGGINLRYNAIDLMKLTTSNLEFYYPSTSSQQKKAISLGTNGAVNSLAFYGFNSNNKTMELTNNGLHFYNPSDGVTELVSFTSGGLVLKKGGIEGGDSNTLVGTNGYVYLSTEDKPGITINGYTPGTNDPKWRQIIGSKFGVDSEGNLYAAGAHIDGNIIAQSLQIGSGINSYNGIAAINISGYDIEITSDSTGVVDEENTTYLYPVLYHNGNKVEEYILSTDTTVDVSKTYYTRSGSEGSYIYTIVSNPTGNPYTNLYYEEQIHYDDFIWYQDDIEPGTAGDANNQGRYLATYGHNYRVVYDFDDGAVGGGTQIQTRTIDPSRYITKINDTGITIHPEVWTNQSSYIQLDGTGMELFNSSGNSIAKYGSSIRIGLNNSSRFLINNNSLQAYDNNNNKYFEFSVNGAQIGKADGAHTVIDEDGMQIYSVDANDNLVELANIGYGDGNAQSGTAIAPYYTFGIREGNSVGNYSVAEGEDTTASGYCSHAEGNNTTASAYASHAEGSYTTASDIASHAEGEDTTASAFTSHAEGNYTTASAYASHAEGRSTIASGYYSHAEGYNTIASGYYSHAGGRNTIAQRKSQIAIGEYNIADTSGTDETTRGNYVFIVGNGTSSQPSNALTVNWNGNVSIAGTLTQSSDRRLKEHISYLDKDAINFVQKLKPAYFKKDSQPHVGFYAQDVEENDPWHCMVGEMNDFKTLGYTEIIAPLVAYCQHLEERIKQLEK